MSASRQKAQAPTIVTATIAGLRALSGALSGALGGALSGEVICALVGVLLVIGTPATTNAQSSRHPTSIARATADQPVEIELRSAARVLVPGETVAVGIRLRPEPGWHSYWRHAGDVGSAPSVEWSLPEGFTADSLRWPAPTLIESPPLASYGYEREVHLLGAIHVPRTARVGSTATFKGNVTWVVCKEECFAADVDLALTLPVAATALADTAAARAIATENARVPVYRADWEFRSAADPKAILLRVRPPNALALTDSDRSLVQFFVDSASVIDHAAPATVRMIGDVMELRLRRSQYATGTPSRLTGVLALAGKNGERIAIEVDAPIGGMAELTSADGPARTFVDSGGWLALATAGLLALVGGTLLNLMPCVLPVLSIKALASPRVQRMTAARCGVIHCFSLQACWCRCGRW